MSANGKQLKRWGAAGLSLCMLAFCFVVSLVNFHDNLEHLAPEVPHTHSVLSAIEAVELDHTPTEPERHVPGSWHHAHPNVVAGLLEAPDALAPATLSPVTAAALEWALDSACRTGPTFALERPPKRTTFA